MSNITLFELNLPEGDIQIGPKTLQRSKDSTSATDDKSDTGSKAKTAKTAKKLSSSTKSAVKGVGRSKLVMLLGIVILVAVGIAATKRFSEEPDDEIAGFEKDRRSA